MKRQRFLIAGLVVLFLAAVIGRYEWKAAHKKAEAQQREARYQSAVRAYSRDLEAGTSRAVVEDYLRAKNVTFGRMCCIQSRAYADITRIGEEDPPWFCNGIIDYVAFDFAPTSKRDEVTADESDRLNTISIFRFPKDCL